MRIFTRAFEIIPEESGRYLFLICLRYILHSSVIPEFLSQKQLNSARTKLNLFLRSHTMQFTSTLSLSGEGQIYDVLTPLVNNMQYFTRTLQTLRLKFHYEISLELHVEILDTISQIRSLTELDLNTKWIEIANFNSFAKFSTALRILRIERNSSCGTFPTDDYRQFDKSNKIIFSLRELSLTYFGSPVLLVQKLCHRKSLRSLKVECKGQCEVEVDQLAEVAPNLTRLELRCKTTGHQRLSHSFPYLQVLLLGDSRLSTLSFLNNSSLTETLLHLTLDASPDLSTTPSGTLQEFLQPLKAMKNLREFSSFFAVDDDCLDHFEEWSMLRSLDLNCSKVSAQRLSQLPGAFWSHMSSLRLSEQLSGVADSGLFRQISINNNNNLRSLSIYDCCSFVNKDLERIHLLGSSLETLLLHCGMCQKNRSVNDEGMQHLKQLSNLKDLHISGFASFEDLSFLQGMQKLKKLTLNYNEKLRGSSFKVFSELCKPKKKKQFNFPFLTSLNVSHLIFSTEHDADEVVCLSQCLTANENLRANLKTLELRNFYFEGGREDNSEYREYLRSKRLEKAINRCYRKAVREGREEQQEWMSPGRWAPGNWISDEDEEDEEDEEEEVSIMDEDEFYAEEEEESEEWDSKEEHERSLIPVILAECRKLKALEDGLHVDCSGPFEDRFVQTWGRFTARWRTADELWIINNNKKKNPKKQPFR